MTCNDSKSTKRQRKNEKKRDSEDSTIETNPEITQYTHIVNGEKEPRGIVCDHKDLLEDYFNNPESSPMDDDLKEKLNFEIIKYIASTGKPFDTLDERLIHILNVCLNFYSPTPRFYTGISRQHITSDTKKLANILRRKLKMVIEKEADAVALTTDAWSSKTKQSFIGVTVHFITKEFALKNFTLAVKPVLGSHTGENIRRWILEILQEFGLDKSKIVMIMRDGGSNMKKGCKLLQVAHETCLAHNIHLVLHPFFRQPPKDIELLEHINSIDHENEDIADYADSDTEENSIDAEDYINKVVANLRRIVIFLRVSGKAKEKLLEFGFEPAISNLPTIPLDVVTRWNSTLDMLRYAVEHQVAIDQFVRYMKSPPGVEEFGKKQFHIISAKEWAILEGLVLLLHDFATISTSLGSVLIPTIVHAYPVIKCMQSRLDNRTLFSDPQQEECADELEDNFEKKLRDFYTKHKNYDYFSETLSTLRACQNSLAERWHDRFEGHGKKLFTIFLNPHETKLKVLSDDEKRIATEDFKTRLIQLALDELMCIQQSKTKTEGIKEETRGIPDILLRGSNVHPISPSRRCNEMLHSLAVQRATCEFEAYLIYTSGLSYCNILDWWKENHSRFPLISQIARTWLICPVTSTPSERVFSDCGFVQNIRRCRLTADHISDQVFIRRNIDKLGDVDLNTFRCFTTYQN